MYTIQVGDIVLITMLYESLNVQRMMNTFHYRFAGPTDISNGAEAVADLVDHVGNGGVVGRWANSWAALSSTDFRLSEVWGQKIWPTRFVRHVLDVDWPGLRAAQGMPGLVQWTITRRGIEAGKGRTGALRVPGISEPDVTFGQLDAAFATDAQTILPNVTNSIALSNPSAQWDPVIFHRLSPPGSQPVLTAQVQTTVRSQRSRINFRGI